METESMQISPASTDLLLDDVERTLSQSGVSRLSPQTLVDMVSHLGDARGLARLRLVEAFGRIGGVAVSALLHGLSTSPNPTVRRSCGKALAKIGDARATDALINALLRDADTVARASAAGALARIGTLALPRLLDVIGDDTTPMSAKGHAAWAIAFMHGGTQAGDALLSSVRHPNADVRLAVVSALGAVVLGDALPVMGAHAEDDWADGDEEEEDREGARRVRESAEQALLHCLNDECGEVRAEAASMLANLKVENCAERIAPLLKDLCEETRRAAALALMKVGDASAIPLLEERCADENEVDAVKNVARLAVSALTRVRDEEGDW